LIVPYTVYNGLIIEYTTVYTRWNLATHSASFSSFSSFILKIPLFRLFFENYPLFPLFFSKSEIKKEDLKTAYVSSRVMVAGFLMMKIKRKAVVKLSSCIPIYFRELRSYSNVISNEWLANSIATRSYCQVIYLESDKQQCVSKKSQNTSFYLTDFQTNLSTFEKVATKWSILRFFRITLPPMRLQ
jgi:hypothetical protein